MRRLVSFFLLLSACLSTHAADSVFARLRPEIVREHAGPVYLLEIAELTARNAGAVVAAGRLVVLTNFTGPRKRFSQTEVQEILAPSLESLGLSLVWGASQETEIRMAQRRLSLDTVVEQGAVELVRYFGKGRQVSVAVSDPIPQMALPAGNVSMTPAIRRMQRNGDVVELPIDVFANGELLGSPVVRYRLRYLDGDPSQVHPVRASSMVVRDAHVRIVSTNGTIRVEAEGIALENAARGQRISVQRPGSPAILVARVVDAETVMLETP